MFITIKTRNGDKEVEAFPTVHPQIVIHRTSFGNDKNASLGFWGITHVPSGFAFVRLLPNREIAELAVPFFVNAGLDLDLDKAGIEKSATPEFKTMMRQILNAHIAVENDVIHLLKLLDIRHYAE